MTFKNDTVRQGFLKCFNRRHHRKHNVVDDIDRACGSRRGRCRRRLMSMSIDMKKNHK